MPVTVVDIIAITERLKLDHSGGNVPVTVEMFPMTMFVSPGICSAQVEGNVPARTGNGYVKESMKDIDEIAKGP